MNTQKTLCLALLTLTVWSACLFGCCHWLSAASGSRDATIQPPTRPVKPTSKQSTASENSVVRIDGELGAVDWNSMIGQQVDITGQLVVVDTYDLIRRGQIKVARQRLYVPTSEIDPNDADASGSSFTGGSNVGQVTKLQKFNDQNTIVIDDGSAKQNIFPPQLFPQLGETLPTVRIGSQLAGVQGKVVKAGRKILLVADRPLNWTPAPRPQRPGIGDAKVTVASFNVLNYFTTIDNGKNNARGADSKSEFKRQEAKIVSAIIALQADVIGLMEIENNVDAEIRLVAALNQQMGRDVFRGCGLPSGFDEAPGGQDAIRVGMIYRSDRVKPTEPVSMIRDRAFWSARTPVVQEFKASNMRRPFAVIVNHFKSKGGAGRADRENKNKGDGQGAYNADRRSQALAICSYIQQRQQLRRNSRILVIGDLNAYQQEDPIDAMRAKGLVDLQGQFADDQSRDRAQGDYSYIYFGQSGSLDHAMATTALAKDVTGIATWHINADEPRFLDYNREFNPPALYQADPFRSSDHDPVLIGIGK